MRSTSVTMRSASSQISCVSVAVVVGRRLLQQLRRAANAGQRILDLMGQHRGQRDHRARRAAMGQAAGPSCRRWCVPAASPRHGRAAPATGATCRSTCASPPMRGVPRSTLYSLTGEPALANLVDQAPASGLPNGTSSFSECRRRNGAEISKNDSAAILASAICRRARPAAPGSAAH